MKVSFLAMLLTTQAFAFQSANNITATTPGSNSIDFALSSGAVARVALISDGLVRVRFNPSGTFTTQLSGAISTTGLVSPQTTVYDTAQAAFLVSSSTVVAVIKQPFQVVILRADGSLVMADQPNGISWDPASGLILDEQIALPDDHYFGLGDRGGPLDRRGRTFYLLNTDWAGYGPLTDPLYISIPFFYGMEGGRAYGLFLDNPAEPFFDFDTEQTGNVIFGAQQGELDYYVMTGPSPASIAHSYAQLTGFSQMPPLWTLGYHQSRYSYTQSEALTVANTLRSMSIPVDSIYFDIGYMKQMQQFTWDPVAFPSPTTMIHQLSQLGVQRVNIFEPLVSNTDPLWPYLAGSDYFLNDSTGEPVVASIWYGNVSFFDFTRDSARDWYTQVLQTFMAQGITGAWNDLNEPAASYISSALYDYDGQPRSDLQARDTYALEENQVNYNAQLGLRPNVRPWALSRSGFAGIQRYAANWSGDQNSTFASLNMSVQITNQMGLSGQNQFGHDVGGFLGSPDAELFIRWLEFGSYIPLFRNHATDTSAPREPYAFGEPYTTMARNIINQRYQLLPYLYSLHRQASQQGAPVVAPALYYFPGDTLTYQQDQEFMLGPNLLVAPVSTAGATTQTVYLPAGTTWFDTYTGTAYQGGQQIVAAAPLQQIPVYAPAGAIIPHGAVKQYVSQAADPDLSIDCYPGANSQFVMYEDDGASFAYQTGSFLETTISSSSSSTAISVRLQRTAGSFLPSAREIMLLLHASAGATSVTLNGSALAQVSNTSSLSSVTSGWAYDSTAHVLSAKFPDSSEPASVVVQ